MNREEYLTEDRNRLHSALADLLTFLEVYPHPAKGAISTYLKTAELAIETSFVGEEIKETTEQEEIVAMEKSDDMIQMVAGALKNMGYTPKEATNLASSVSGDTIEDRIKNALMSTTTLRPCHSD